MMHPIKIQCLKKNDHNSYIHVVLIVTHCWNRCFLNYAKYGISDFDFSFPSPQNIPPIFINMGFVYAHWMQEFFLWATFLHSLRLHILIFDKTIKSWNIIFLWKTIIVHKIHWSITNQKETKISKTIMVFWACIIHNVSDTVIS